MARGAALFLLLLCSILACGDDNPPSYPTFDYVTAAKHELKPHRTRIPLQGVKYGFEQIHLTLTVSAAGDVIDAVPDAGGDPSGSCLRFWPQVQDEVYHWRFSPFEKNGKSTIASVEEIVNLVLPERLPKTHVPAPRVLPNSKVSITLERTGCFGACPSYMVTVGTEGIAFEGSGYVVASGKHADTVDPDEVRDLAKGFVSADFYSMDSSYVANLTDNPTYTLAISIDGHSKKVTDYAGEQVGMPSVITELEDEVDKVARTSRWIDGDDGLVAALREEKYDFRTFAAQAMLKAAEQRGQTATVRELLESGVPLNPLPPSANDRGDVTLYRDEGWLTSASQHPETLRLFINAGAGKNDQRDKDLALVSAARTGNVEAARALISYGANPNADLSGLEVTQASGGMEMGENGAGSILIYAAESGNPAMVREILSYHPKIEARDRRGQTAIFAAGESHYNDKDGARVECIRLLAQAGANVNARDKDGNTPLHETFLDDVEEELLKLGADVNARNNDGETPIFTTVDLSAFRRFIEQGADLTVRNKDGETAMQAARKGGPAREKALREAIAETNPN